MLEIMLERRRLKAEALALKAEKPTATPERLKSMRQRTNYIRRRVRELIEELAATSARRKEQRASLPRVAASPQPSLPLQVETPKAPSKPRSRRGRARR